MAAKKKEQKREIQITAPKINEIIFTIKGNAPYVQNAFSKKAKEAIKATQAQGSGAKNKRKKEPKDFEECFNLAQHVSQDGWKGIPANSFRAAMISACRLVGFKMTLAKLSVFVVADGFDASDGTPLIKIKGKPEYCEHMVRLQGKTCDLRVRAMWREWSAKVRVQYDSEQFTAEDMSNLMSRVGLQVGLGEGRPDSKMSTGMGWGTFTVE